MPSVTGKAIEREMIKACFGYLMETGAIDIYVNFRKVFNPRYLVKVNL